MTSEHSGEIAQALAEIRQERREQMSMLTVWHQFVEGVFLQPPDTHCTHWFGGGRCHLCGDDVPLGSELGPCDRSLVSPAARIDSSDPALTGRND